MSFNLIRSLITRPVSYIKVQGIEGTRTYRLRQIYQNPSSGSLFELFKRAQFHGTSEKLIGDQIEKGAFDNLGKPIYFDSKETAVRYAQIKAGDESNPILLKISSKIKPKMNDWLKKELGLYSFFPADPDKPVVIQEAYLVEKTDE